MEIRSEFNSDEGLLRAVYPPDCRPSFWKKDGTLSSAALKDKRGLSVDRTYDRSMKDAITFIRETKQGYIISVNVEDCECKEVSALVLYKPSENNPYHSEIHGSEESIILGEIQARELARKAVVRYDPVLNVTYC